MMSLSDILRGIFHAPPPPPVEMKSDEIVKDESEIRWEKALANKRLRRARELQIDVDMEQRNEN